MENELDRAARSYVAAESSLDRARGELELRARHVGAALDVLRREGIDRLAELDRGLMQAATAELDRDAVATARREAEAELAAFGARMAPEVRAQAVEAAFERLVRDTLGLPQVRYQ